MKSGLSVVILFCLSLSGCIKQREGSPKETQSNAAFSLGKKSNGLAIGSKGQSSALPDQAILASNEFQAVLKDISLPITFYQTDEKPFFQQYSPDEYCLCFITPLNIEQLLAFYRQEMEFLGWREWSMSCHAQLLALFKKPYHVALIEAQPLDNEVSKVTITILKRERKNRD